jgi:hypothetical protein
VIKRIMKNFQPLIATAILAALTSPALAAFDYPGRVYSSEYRPDDCIKPDFASSIYSSNSLASICDFRLANGLEVAGFTALSFVLP